MTSHYYVHLNSRSVVIFVKFIMLSFLPRIVRQEIPHLVIVGNYWFRLSYVFLEEIDFFIRIRPQREHQCAILRIIGPVSEVCITSGRMLDFKDATG